MAQEILTAVTINGVECQLPHHVTAANAEGVERKLTESAATLAWLRYPKKPTPPWANKMVEAQREAAIHDLRQWCIDIGRLVDRDVDPTTAWVLNLWALAEQLEMSTTPGVRSRV